MAFFLESTFVGLFFFGWDKLSKEKHLMVTFLVALGSNLSALWILIANGWMQNPVGAEFNYETMRMEMTSFAALIFNPVAQVKFVHTVAAGYTTASMFVLGISSWYLLKKRDIGFALRSIAVASGFGLASILSVIILGDESGYATGEVQKVKLAAIESEWHTEPAPAAFTAFGLPNQTEERTDYAVKIPYLLGLIATRSLDEEVTGLIDIKNQNEIRIRNGMQSYADLQRLKEGDKSDESIAAFDKTKQDLGFGLLLKKYTPNITDATEAQIKQAASDTIPNVFTLFWSFRVMVAMAFLMFFIFAASFYFTIKRSMEKQTWLLRLALYATPAPWIAAEMGWIVAEMGRQPWTISGILPTHLSTSSLSAGNLYFSLASFIGFYTLLLVIEMYLMFKYTRLGPSSLYTGRYFFEKNPPTAVHA